jgi:hypothetical protein
MILPTKKQLKVLAFIKAQKTFPTHPQIASHFGWASDNASRAHVAALLKKKLLKKRADGKLSVASTDPRSVN